MRHPKRLVVILLLILVAHCAGETGGRSSGSDGSSAWTADAALPRDTTPPADARADEAVAVDTPLDVLATLVDLGQPDTGHVTATDADTASTGGSDADTASGGSCNFTYLRDFPAPVAPTVPFVRVLPLADAALPEAPPARATAHIEPEPPGYVRLPLRRAKDGRTSIVMPEYEDDMPLFDRAKAWDAPRCYETPAGAETWTEDEAFDHYRLVAEATTGVPFPTALGVRVVVGLRGAYPGTFVWNGNTPNYFNDTLVLLWQEQDGTKRVRELPANTDTGAHDFGPESSSSLRPNRRYRYRNGWHRGYNALEIAEEGYRVRDDANHNGHWDSDRNGWLPPADGEDHDRVGSAHNIHMGALDGPLGAANVDYWSAGCQVIPGISNWTAFITNAWTRLGDLVPYYLVDARDIAPEAFAPCTPDGTAACPYRIDRLPSTIEGNTATSAARAFTSYACSDVDESGPEVVYLLTIDRKGVLTVSVSCAAPVDVDVQLLDAADPRACLARAHAGVDYEVGPGRYFVVVDTFSDGTADHAGPFTLAVSIR